MATYISLVKFTDKGIQAAKQTTERVADWSAKVRSRGVSIKQMYWTLGQYDQVCIFEGTRRRDGRQRVTRGGHAGQHPHTDNACFHSQRDGEHFGQDAVMAKPRGRRSDQRQDNGTRNAGGKDRRIEDRFLKLFRLRRDYSESFRERAACQGKSW